MSLFFNIANLGGLGIVLHRKQKKVKKKKVEKKKVLGAGEKHNDVKEKVGGLPLFVRFPVIKNGQILKHPYNYAYYIYFYMHRYVLKYPFFRNLLELSPLNSR